MANTGKLAQLIRTQRGPGEIQDWLFSLTPLGVAFAFFLVFLMPMDIPNKDIIMVTGIAAGFTGLESYWVFRGWKKNHGSTVMLGLIGIALTIALTWSYIAFFSRVI